MATKKPMKKKAAPVRHEVIEGFVEPAAVEAAYVHVEPTEPILDAQIYVTPSEREVRLDSLLDACLPFLKEVLYRGKNPIEKQIALGKLIEEVEKA